MITSVSPTQTDPGYAATYLIPITGGEGQPNEPYFIPLQSARTKNKKLPNGIDSEAPLKGFETSQLFTKPTSPSFQDNETGVTDWYASFKNADHIVHWVRV